MFGGDFTDGDSGSGLFVDEGTEPSLAFDDAIGDSHFAAQGGQPDDQFDGINVVGNDDELSLFGFDEGGDVVESVFDGQRFLSLVESLTGSFGSGSDSQTLLLLNFAFGLVFVEEAEQGGGRVLVQSASELVDGGGDLQTTLQNGTLTLQTNIFGPFDITSQIAFTREDILTNRKVTRSLFEEGITNSLGSDVLLLGNDGSGCNLLGR